MRFIQFKPLHEQRLDEINMSPASLRQLAAKIEGARAGLEFELVVRGMSDENDDGESEPDYDSNERAGNIDEVCEFFDDGEHNNSRGIRRLREKLDEDFVDWQSEKVNSDFEMEVADLLATYFHEEDGLEGEELDTAVDDEIARPGRALDNVRETFEEDNRSNYDEQDWFRSQGWRTMRDIHEEYNDVTWPHWTYGSQGGGDVSAEDAAKSFEQAVGREVHVSTGYHDYNVKRQGVGDTFYIAEPDSSIEGDDGDGGLEFVAPPLSVQEMITDMRKVVAWCRAGNAYANESTGLHMNISVPNYNWQRLDFIKLALLMGDDHVSSSFGRLGAHYAKSALAIVKKKIQNDPESAQALLDQMKTHLNAAASKIVHSGNTDKYTSINTKDGRVEFRSPGGDWVSDYESGGKVENTLLRFVVALDAACDPAKYKDEYAKKLYKLLSTTDSGNSVQYFAKYVAGEMPATALKSFVRSAQLEREIKKAEPAGPRQWLVSVPGKTDVTATVTASNGREAVHLAMDQEPELMIYKPEMFDATPVPTGDDAPKKQYAWEVTYSGNGSSTAEVVAATAQDAKAAGRDKLGFTRATPLGMFNARPMRKHEGNAQPAVASGPAPTWEIFDRESNETVLQLHVQTGMEAYQKMMEIPQYASTGSYGVRQIEPTSANTQTSNNEPGRYEIYNTDTGAQVATFAANGMGEALDRAEVELRMRELGNASHNVRTVADGERDRQSRAPARQPRAAEMPPRTTRQFWSVSGANGQYVSVPAASAAEAGQVAAQRYGSALGPQAEYEITPIPA